MSKEEAKAKPVSGGSLSSGTRDLLSGMIAGFCVKVVEYPFDTIKVLQQTMGSRYTGALDCLSTTYRGGGIAALYKGLASPLMGSMVECSTLFVSYGWMKKILNVDEASATLARPVPMWKYYVSGAWSGVCVAFVLTPVELIKCRLQVQAGEASAAAVSFSATKAASGARYAGPIDCATQIIKQEGVRGLWRGNGACLVREIPGNIAWFGGYELVVKAVQWGHGYERKSEVPLAWSALAGSVAGVCYWGVPFPADTVKSKLQTDPRFLGKSFVDVFRTVLKEEGVAGLYRGAAITCIRVGPAHALLFVVYEAADRWLQRF